MLVALIKLCPILPPVPQLYLYGVVIWQLNVCLGEKCSTFSAPMALPQGPDSPSNCIRVTFSQGDDIPLSHFSREGLFRSLCNTKITAGVGTDSLSSSLSRHGAVTMTDAFIYLITMPVRLFSIPDCSRLLTIIPIPKSSGSTDLAKRVRLIALTCSGLKLTVCCAYASASHASSWRSVSVRLQI